MPKENGGRRDEIRKLLKLETSCRVAYNYCVVNVKTFASRIIRISVKYNGPRAFFYYLFYNLNGYFVQNDESSAQFFCESLTRMKKIIIITIISIELTVEFHGYSQFVENQVNLCTRIQ